MHDHTEPAFLQLTLPLSDTFTVSDFAGTEALSELFTYRVTAYCVNTEIDTAKLIGKGITLQSASQDGHHYSNTFRCLSTQIPYHPLP